MLSSRHRAVSEVRRRRSANLNEIPELLTKLPAGLDSLTLEAHCRVDSQCILNIKARCPNLRKLVLGAVTFRVGASGLDLQPLADQLTHFALIKSPIPWTSFTSGSLIFSHVQVFDISLGDLLQPSLDFIRVLPQFLPEVRILRIAVSHGQSADLTGDWMRALRSMRNLRELYVGSENRCLRQTSAPSGDPLQITDDRLHRLELPK